MAKQTRITIRHDSLVVLRGRNSKSAWCPACGAEGEMIALERSAVISNLPSPGLEGWLDSRDVHRSQAPDGSSLVCLNSLMACVLNKNKS